MTGLVIFDCDGVVVDSEPLANRVLHARLTALGLTLSLDESARRFTGRSMASCVTIIEAMIGGPVPPDFVAGVRRETRTAFEAGLEAVPGIVAVLQALAFPSCLASSGSHEKIRRSLRLTGTDRYFDDRRIFSAEDVREGKPAPDLFLHAASSCGVPPEDCVVVEDSVPGVEAAVVAGMRALGFAARTPPRALAAAGATIFIEMEQLPGLLGHAAG
jgi:HAD superfamily hydrolase (TIGR01509 family)